MRSSRRGASGSTTTSPARPRSRREAEAVIAAYQQTLAEARAQAQATIKERTERFAAEAAERQRQLAAALAEQTRAAEQEIAAAKERAFAEIRNVAVDVARSITEKLTGAARR